MLTTATSCSILQVENITRSFRLYPLHAQGSLCLQNKFKARPFSVMQNQDLFLLMNKAPVSRTGHDFPGVELTRSETTKMIDKWLNYREMNLAQFTGFLEVNITAKILNCC